MLLPGHRIKSSIHDTPVLARSSGRAAVEMESCSSSHGGAFICSGACAEDAKQQPRAFFSASPKPSRDRGTVRLNEIAGEQLFQDEGPGRALGPTCPLLALARSEGPVPGSTRRGLASHAAPIPPLGRPDTAQNNGAGPRRQKRDGAWEALGAHYGGSSSGGGRWFLRI